MKYECSKVYFCEPGNVCSCEMLDFGAVKCDLFNARERWFTIKMLHKMTIIGVKE